MIPLPHISDKNIVPLFYSLIASLPIIYGLSYIVQYGVNIPLWDQWVIAKWVIAYYEGNFEINWLLDTQSDSRSPFSFLVMIALSVLTDFNIKILYYVGYIFYTLASLLIFFEARKDTGNNLKYLILLLPVTFYWFNPYYLARFIFNLGGFQYGFMVFTVILTTLILDRSRTSNVFFGCSIFMAIISSFSGVWGLLIWFSGFIQILLQNAHYKLHKSVIWILFTASTFYLYFIAMPVREEGIHGTVGYQSYIETTLTYPFHKFLCYLGTLGSQIVHNKEIALFFGAILICIFAALLLNNRHKLMVDKLSKWYALLAFWGAASLAVGLTRSGTIVGWWGPPDTIFFIPDFRHSPIIFFTLIGVYIITLIYLKHSIGSEKPDENLMTDKNSNLADKRSINTFLFGIVFTLLTCGIMMHMVPGITLGHTYLDTGIQGQYYLKNYDHMSDEQLKILHPNPTIIREIIPKIEEYRLGVFSDSEGERYNRLPQFGSGINISDLPRLSTDTYCGVESLNDIRNPMQQEMININVTETPFVILSGWAVDSPHDSVAKAVFISVDEEIMVPAWCMQERKDVAKYFENPTLKDSGFWGSVNVSQLEDGHHTMTLKIVPQDENGYYESKAINLEVVS